MSDLSPTRVYHDIRTIIDLILDGKVASMGLIAAITSNLDDYAIHHRLTPACCVDDSYVGDIRVSGDARIEIESSRYAIRRGFPGAVESWDDFEGWGSSVTFYVTERLARKAALRAGLGEGIPVVNDAANKEQAK